MTVVVVGMIHIPDPSWLVNITKLLYPSSGGRGPTKSMATKLQCSSGTGSGCMLHYCRNVRLAWVRFS